MEDPLPPSPAMPAADDNALLVRSTLGFPVVGIGASAGGLKALLRLFEHMPSASGMAFVVVLHLSPKHVSNASAVLQGVTKMAVAQVTGAMRIEADRVYVVPPSRNLSMNDGHLYLSAIAQPKGRHASIDLFFRSLALAHRERAIAIVLSGSGSDGAVGIARVKEQGGVTLAQQPADAEFDAMPRAALATGMVDWSLPVVDMPQKLLDIWANARCIELPPGSDGELQIETTPPGDTRAQAEAAFRDIMGMLRSRTGHDFKHYKRATVLRRLERRLQVNSLHNLPDYRAHLAEQPAEAKALLKDLLIGVTNFFRDREAFEALERQVLPVLFERPPGNGDGDDAGVRVWVVGCATGEEAYSMAMLALEAAAEQRVPPDLQVFATDIDDEALAVARSGAYPASIVTDVPPMRLRKFFSHEDQRYRIRKELRESVLFAAHNVLRDPPFSRLDLICCRNLLIYLDRDVQAQILQNFHFALRPGGYLFLGNSETADSLGAYFVPVDKKHRIYRANPMARQAHGLPVLPFGASSRKSGELPGLPSQRTRSPYAEVHQRLLEQYAPPSVLVDADANIVHLSEHAGRFLHHIAGAPSHHLMSLVQPELRLELRTALYQAVQSGKSVEARRVQVARDGRPVFVNMIVRPVPASENNGPLVLVLFDEVEATMAAEGAENHDAARDPVMVQLEDELRRTKEQLQLTIEQAETSTEELKASNEELQAINEELRSTTEELETSREELQSINEELITVNYELKLKVEETGHVNDDLQNLVTSTDLATVFVDRGMAIKRYTPRAAEIFNLRPSDLGRSLLDLTHRLDYAQLADDAALSFQSLQLIEREVTGEGGRTYLARMLPYRTTEDIIGGAVLTFVDITGRIDAEAHLRGEEARMRLIARSTVDHAIVTLDAGGRVTTWNDGAVRMFGFAEAEIVGRPIDLIFTPEDRAQGKPEDEMRHAREDGRAEDDRWHLRRDGSRVFCSGIMTPLRQDGELHGYAKIARDLTDRKLKESERDVNLRREITELAEVRAASQLKDEFLAVMSHELKNPLNLIHLNAELLARLPEAKALPSVARAAEIIRKTVMSQARIIDDLLDLSRMNTGKLSLNRAPVDWSQTVSSIVEAVGGDAREKGLTLDLQPADAPLIVDADPVRLEQIVWNLLSNALKFTPVGGRVAVALRREANFGVLEVRDSGRGIDPQQLPKMFGMFQQENAQRPRNELGLGIGLAIVNQLAALHGGSVEGASEGLGQGSAFTVRLPLHGHRTPQPNAPAADAEGSLRGVRAFVLDDDAANTETLRELLSLDGAEVTASLKPVEALGLLAASPFDVLISDIDMPEMDGYTLIAALRAEPATRDLLTIALTGFGRAADARKALAAGFDAHLGKPVTLERLTATLLRLMRDGKGRGNGG